MIVIRTQKELASAVEVTPEYIRDIKKGRRRLSNKRKLLLMEFYRRKILQLQTTIDGMKD